MLIAVTVLTPAEVIFEGRAKNIILPGELGAFEIMPFHRRILSRLISGTLFIDGQGFPIRRGLIAFSQNVATIVVEEAY
jgi:F0F1-type ATP synthase epsilon subunit